jgi:hypothetical protein
MNHPDKTSGGIVYILTNEAMPGYIKIGRTDGDLTVRVRQLDSTGVPLPFEVFYAARVADSGFVERQLHAAFGDRRVRSNREFFTVEPSRVRAALELAGLEEVTPGREVVETADDRRALEVAKQRRSNFRFSMIGIGPGSVLVSTFDSQITCEVVDDRTVRFREQLTSLSDAARQISAEKGRGDQARQGPLYWTIDGHVLSELRDAVDSGEEVGPFGRVADGSLEETPEALRAAARPIAYGSRTIEGLTPDEGERFTKAIQE